jgi:hypothetical protein
MFAVERLFNHLGSKPYRLHILIASKAVNTDQDIVKKFSNNLDNRGIYTVSTMA